VGSRRVAGRFAGPFNVAITPSAVYFTEQGAGTLTVIDPKTLKVVATRALFVAWGIGGLAAGAEWVRYGKEWVKAYDNDLPL
jgi:DNA-binding beta-propeller fold protein YncE